MKINENIYRATMPYKDIFTTVYLIKAAGGAMLFDCGSFDEDTEAYLLPFLKEHNIGKDELKYIFISHNHTDHSGGLSEFIKSFPDAVIVSPNEALWEKFKGYNILSPKEGDEILDVLKVVEIPGHTKDSCGIFDTRTKTLISGDSLQLYGIIGSGKWASNIGWPKAHIAALEKLGKMDIEEIYTAHDYQPYGYSYKGKDEIRKALEACAEPLYKIKDLIIKNPHLSDEEVCAVYNSFGGPTLGAHVVGNVRRDLI